MNSIEDYREFHQIEFEILAFPVHSTTLASIARALAVSIGLYFHEQFPQYIDPPLEKK